MARKLSSPLTQADIKWLRARYPENRVQAMIADAGQADEAPEEDEETGDGDSDADGADGPENGGEDAEDLIGTPGETFNPSEHTVDEVTKHLATASDEEKARVLAAEADGKARSTILNA